MKKTGIGLALAGLMIALYSLRSQLLAIFVMLKTGISLKLENPEMIAVIGGADGPTEVFVAGKCLLRPGCLVPPLEWCC